ncbi:copper resistance CopC family protein [Kribbella sp. NPDC055110]
MRRVLLAAVAVALTSLAAFPAPAAAHTRLIASVPRDGVVLAVGPPRVSFTFDQQLQQFHGYTTILVTGPDGSSWPIGPVQIEGHSISAAVGELGPHGRYVFSYRVVAADSHPVAGRIAVTVSYTQDGVALLARTKPSRSLGWVLSVLVLTALGAALWGARRRMIAR